MVSSNVNIPLTVLATSYVAPCFESPELATEFSLLLTFFDTLWLKFPPVERIFFYEFEGLTPDIFNFEILPRLEHSLSVTLSQFLRLAGNLTWHDNATNPMILYSPIDAVSVIVAESNEDFGLVSSKNIHEAALSRPYVPELPVSDTKASIIALQITLFPNQGFCVGITSHHAILDGKSTTMFMKAWAYMCKGSEDEKRACLPPELTPFMDRKVIKDPERLDIEFLNFWLGVKRLNTDTSNLRSLKLLPSVITTNDLVRATFLLSRENFRKLKGMVTSYLTTAGHTEDESLHLSSFVLSFAYTAVCIAKAKALESKANVRFGFTADCRQRLDPHVHENYFGNCVTFRYIDEQLDYSKGTILENFVFIVKKFSELIKGLDKGVNNGLKEQFAKLFEKSAITTSIGIGVAGSNKFGVYEIDFGWGKPVLVEVTSIDRTGAISMAESKEGHGGVEIGAALQRHEMEKFVRLFVDGIKDE